MSHSMIYRGYAISSAPTTSDETDQWQLRVSISWDKDGTINSKPVSTPIAYPTELEADLHGSAFAQRIIDGKVPGITIEE